MSLVLDYSTTRPAPAAMKAAGAVGVARYIGLGSRAKRIDAPERDRLHAQGLGITLVAEGAADRTTGGHDLGAADARTARAEASALGYPAEKVLFYAVDFDARWSQVEAYFAGAASVDPHWGVYGSAAICVAATGDTWRRWVTTAWSHHQRPPCALYQRVGGPVAARFSGTDENDLYEPNTLWLPGQAAPTPATPPAPHQEDTMAPLAVRDDTDGSVWVTTADPAPGRWHVPDADALTSLLILGAVRVNGTGGTPATVPHRMLARIPVVTTALV